VLSFSSVADFNEGSTLSKSNTYLGVRYEIVLAEKVKIIYDQFQQAIERKIEFRDWLEQALDNHKREVENYNDFWQGKIHDRFVSRYVNEQAPRYQTEVVECFTAQINDMKRILREKKANDKHLASLLTSDTEVSNRMKQTLDMRNIKGSQTGNMALSWTPTSTEPTIPEPLPRPALTPRESPNQVGEVNRTSSFQNWGSFVGGFFEQGVGFILDSRLPSPNTDILSTVFPLLAKFRKARVKRFVTMRNIESHIDYQLVRELLDNKKIGDFLAFKSRNEQIIRDIQNFGEYYSDTVRICDIFVTGLLHNSGKTWNRRIWK